MTNVASRPKGSLLLAAGLLLMPMTSAVHGEAVALVWSGPTAPVAAGGTAELWLNALNPSAQQVSWLFPEEIQCRLIGQTRTADVSAVLRGGASPGPAIIPPGSFARREYALPIPGSWTGDVTVEFRELAAAPLGLAVRSPPEFAIAAAPEGGLLPFLKGEHQAEAGAEYDPDTFFKEHIFGYEPFYFIAGTRSPNARFQISFKYRLLNEYGWLARKAPWLTGLHLAYTQTSLWDWNGPSAPFYDSSYKPELLYSWQRLIGGGPTNWFHLDIQGGFRHESNGKAGADSRSLNIAYLQPTFVFGRDRGPQLRLLPQVWTYLGDLSDNPDIADYRGYGDLRMVCGWKRGLEISALGRIGKNGEHAALQFDVTYPLMQPPYGSFSLYLQAQYFTGYGESLLGYREKSEAFRAGISLYR